MSEFNVALLMLDKKIGHNSMLTNYKISAEDDIYN